MTARSALPLLSVLLALPAACGPEIDAPALDAVRGRWETTDERYAERAFELTEDETLRLQIGADEYREHPLGLVEASPLDRSRQAYRLRYRDDDGVESEFRFDFTRGDASIRFANQPRMVWRRVEP